MMRTIVDVVRGEGWASAFVRTCERIEEAIRGLPNDSAAEIINYAPGGVAARTGGIAVQLMARLRAERALRPVFVCGPDIPVWPFRGAYKNVCPTLHIEGTFGLDVPRVLASGMRVIVSLHDETLTDRRLLDAATGVIVASSYLRDRYGIGEVVAPASDSKPAISAGDGLAYAGSVKPHKGGALLPAIAKMLAERDLPLHVFGGGDVDLLRALREHRNVAIHGYYRAGSLPTLLARHRIGFVFLPSIVAEAFSLTLSESWLAGAFVAAFDLGAPAERIRREGGGALAPLASGAAGLIDILDRWRAQRPPEIVHHVSTPADAAKAHLDLYRRWGVLRA